MMLKALELEEPSEHCASQSSLGFQTSGSTGLEYELTLPCEPPVFILDAKLNLSLWDQNISSMVDITAKLH